MQTLWAVYACTGAQLRGPVYSRLHAGAGRHWPGVHEPHAAVPDEGINTFIHSPALLRTHTCMLVQVAAGQVYVKHTQLFPTRASIHSQSPAVLRTHACMLVQVANGQVYVNHTQLFLTRALRSHACMLVQVTTGQVYVNHMQLFPTRASTVSYTALRSCVLTLACWCRSPPARCM